MGIVVISFALIIMVRANMISRSVIDVYSKFLKLPTSNENGRDTIYDNSRNWTYLGLG